MAILMWQGGDLQEVSAECPHLLKEGQKMAPSCGEEGSCRVLIGVTKSELVFSSGFQQIPFNYTQLT